MPFVHVYLPGSITQLGASDYKSRPRGYKTSNMLNSAEREFSRLIGMKMRTRVGYSSYLLAEKSSCSAMLSMKEFAIMSNLRF